MNELKSDQHSSTTNNIFTEIKKVTSKDTPCRTGTYKRNNEKFVLKRNHKYFYQRQQLFFSRYKQSLGKGKASSYLTSVIPLPSRARVFSQEDDGVLILPPSFHQCSVLRVVKATLSYTEMKEVETRM